MTGGAISYTLLLLAGCALGLFFYGGLWFTIRALCGSRHPVLLMLASFWGRTAVVIACFLLLMDQLWQNAALCLAGFVLARFVCARLMPNPPAGKGAA
ncbi:MAG: ATP synthase subunit I [Acidobacteriales bacterium]|nr:ATP synthase subunit I [Terriglobales bacterium]